MCGITGFFGFFDQVLLDQMVQRIAHRGPDAVDSIIFQRHGVGLAHRRLSIIDLSEDGCQPMTVQCACCGVTHATKPEESLWLIYNGELYNYQELRAELINKGHHFYSKTDSEVLLHLYAEYGPKMLEQLNGIFALAIYDGRQHGQHDGMQPGDLLLARDGLGVKPLYYTETPQGFLFSSELKSLLASEAVNREIDPLAIQQYLGYLWSPAPRTPFLSVKKVEPGQAILVRQRQCIKQWYYYDLPYGGALFKDSEAAIARALSEQVKQAVNRQLIADVPVGAFLSGGLDSSSIVAMMRNLNPEKNIKCYTIGFNKRLDEGFPDDVPYAQQVAKLFKLDLTVLRVGPEIIKHLEQMIYFMDEPQADPAAINAYLIAQRARQDGVKVLLSGVGGDDIFSGYRRHAVLHYETKIENSSMLKSFFRMVVGGMQKSSHSLSKSILLRRIYKFLENYSNDIDLRIASHFLWGSESSRFSLLSPELKSKLINEDVLDPLFDSLHRVKSEKSMINKMLYLEAKHFLADHNLNYTDKATMAFGVETRVPLLDKELVAFATKIPPQYKQKGRLSKAIFKKSMEAYLPNKVIYRKKTGFGAPLRHWIANELKPLVHEVLSAEALQKRGLFDAKVVYELIKSNEAGYLDASYTIFSLLTIELWCRAFVDNNTQSIF